MSKTTLRKRLSLVVASALAAGVLTSVGTQSANAHNTAVGSGETNTLITVGTINGSMAVATKLSTTGSAVVGGPSATTQVDLDARSLGLLAKDSSSGTAQTATMLAGGTLSFYAKTAATDMAFVASGGTFAGTSGTGYNGALTSWGTNQTRTIAYFDVNTSTSVAQLWTAPTTPGSYTVSLYTSTSTQTVTLDLPTRGDLAAAITVTVVASSAGGSYSAAKSNCVTKTDTTAATLTSVDSTSTFLANGSSWYIGYLLNDAYGADLASGNIVASATNGALVNIGTDGAALAAGTGSTVVAFDAGNSDQVRVSQPTAGAPLTTTVTITYNGTTVCTKTVSIAGAAASIAVSDVAAVDLGGADTNANWLSDAANRSGHFYIVLRDAANNIVVPASASEFAIDSTTLSTTVTGISVNSTVATSTSSTSVHSKSVGTFTCGTAAGARDIKIQHTSSSTGNVITSPAFNARCADDSYTYTASWDKAKYVQGELATLTVKFLDSRGNAANSLDTPGAVTIVAPMLTAVTTTGVATVLPNNKGEITYTFTVGTSSGITAGSYVSIIDYTALTAVAAVKATPSYSVSTGGDTTTNADVLKSIVALIASINKQIQALQKLILKR